MRRAVLPVSLAGLLGAFCVAVPAAQAGPVQWSDCGASFNPFQTTSVSVAPSPPRAGHSLTVTVHGTLSERLTGGTLSLTIRTPSQAEFTESEPLASVMNLPQKPGRTFIAVSSILPAPLPSGLYQLTLSSTDQTGALLMCVGVNQTIGSPSG